MLLKNAIQKIHVYAYDSTTGAPKTGDAANITGYVSLDGTANAIDDTNPAEVDSTNMPGVYVFDLTAAETNCDSFALYAKSSTANIRIEPIIGFTTAGTAAAVSAVVPDNQKVDVNTIKTQAVTCASGVTVYAYVGTAAADTAQTGDSYAVVNHADYGNAKLVRSTTPANTLSVDAAHLVAVPTTQKVDVETIKTQAITCSAGVTVGVYVGGTGAAALASEVTAARMGALTDWIDGGRLDLLLDGVKTKTDYLPAAAAGSAGGVSIVGSAMTLAAGSIVTATFGTCVTPETANTAKMSFTGTGPYLLKSDTVAWVGNEITSVYEDETIGNVPVVCVSVVDASGKQDIRDALKLAPTAGAPAAGSTDADLDTLTTRIPQTLSMAQIGGTGPYYVLALDDAGASLPTAAEVLTALGTGGWITAAQISATVGWGGSALPTIGTSTLTAQQVWEYATRTLTAFGFTVAATGDWVTDSDIATLAAYGDVHWSTATGFSTHSAADVVTALGTGSTLTALAQSSSWTSTLATNLGTLISDWTNGGRLDTILDATAAAAAKFDTMVALDGAVYQFTANAVELAPGGGSGGDATAANQTIIIDHLTDIKGTGWGSADNLHVIAAGVACLSGDGVLTGVLTITDADDVPLVGAIVDCRDANGNLLARGTTDANGQVTTWGFNAQAVTFAAFLVGYTPNTGSLTISAAGWTKTVKLTAVSITPPSTPSTSTLYTYCYEHGLPKAGVVVQIQLKDMPAGTGQADLSRLWEDTSDANGLVEFVGVVQSAVYWVAVRNGSRIEYTTTTAATQQLPNIFGVG